MKLVEKTLSGVKDTLKEFGLPLSVVTSIGASMNDKAEASANGLGQFEDLDANRIRRKQTSFLKAITR